MYSTACLLGTTNHYYHDSIEVVCMSKEDYRKKDMIKFKDCTELITYGAIGSSSHHYYTTDNRARNSRSEDYIKNSVVGISINGRRPNRLGLSQGNIIHKEILKAAEANATFVTDNPINRYRGYNIGEKEVANLLLWLGYTGKNDSIRTTWTKKTT